MSVPQVPNLREAITKDQVVTTRWWSWFDQLWRQFPATTFSGTITTAKLTGGGTNGSMTFKNGILVSVVPAT